MVPATYGKIIPRNWFALYFLPLGQHATLVLYLTNIRYFLSFYDTCMVAWHVRYVHQQEKLVPGGIYLWSFVIRLRGIQSIFLFFIVISL